MPKPIRRRLTIELPPSLHERLERLAQQQGNSTASVARSVLANALLEKSDRHEG